jgi:hypothetical protein
MTPARMSVGEYKKLALKKCEDNHIWLNKMMYMFPTDEQKIKLADAILEKLKTKSTQIPGESITDNTEVGRELAELTPVLYLKVNWS